MMEYSLFDILEDLDIYAYACDIDTNELVFLNRKCRELEGMKDHGICYKVLQGLDEPCPFCNNDMLIQEKHLTWQRYNDNFHKTFTIYDKLIETQGRRIRLEFAFEMHGGATETVNNILRTDQNIIRCMQMLSKTEKYEDAVYNILKQLLMHYNGDRTYIFEWNWENNTVDNTYEVCKAGVPPQIDNLQNLPADMLSLWVKSFEKSKFLYIKDIELLKDDVERREEYEQLKPQGIKNLMAVPIIYDNKIQGFIGIDNPQDNKENTEFLFMLSYFLNNEMEKRHSHKKLLTLSYYDYLTSLPNRNKFNEDVEVFSSQKGSVGVIFADVNGLKIVNDTYGHAFGDQLIKHLSRILKSEFNINQIYRISGDEFVIFMLDCSYEEYACKFEKLKKIVNEDNETVASVGGTWNENRAGIRKLIYEAEQVMYINKQKFYEKHLEYSTKHKPKLLNALVHDIKHNAFEVFIQPKYDCIQHRYYGGEALIRKNVEGHIISPAQFIEAYEKEKIVYLIDFFVLDRVCMYLEKWYKEGKNPVISVNMSRVTIEQSDFCKQVNEICGKYTFEHSMLKFEVTETIKSIDKNHLSKVFDTIRGQGYGLALDDYGVRESTLEMFVNDAFDTIKIDKYLVIMAQNSTRTKIVLSNIANVCTQLGLNCVAEGVENEAQLKMVNDMGINKIQGYYYGKPMPVTEFENIIKGE